jgi:hypothetical protein
VPASKNDRGATVTRDRGRLALATVVTDFLGCAPCSAVRPMRGHPVAMRGAPGSLYAPAFRRIIFEVVAGNHRSWHTSDRVVSRLGGASLTF